MKKDKRKIIEYFMMRRGEKWGHLRMTRQKTDKQID